LTACSSPWLAAGADSIVVGMAMRDMEVSLFSLGTKASQGPGEQTIVASSGWH
jgi:hypothetical protein